MVRITVLLAAACLASAGAAAQTNDLVAYQGTNAIRLTDTACTDAAVLERIEPQARPHFRQARATVDGKSYRACWGALPMAVVLVYEDGDQGVLPLSALQRPVDI